MTVNDWNRKIIEESRENDGRVGGMFAGAPMRIVAERPGFGEYQEQAGRVIPVVELTRT